MNTETTTGEYMLLFRGPHWDRGLPTDELQHVMDKVIAWFEALNERSKIKSAQPLGSQGRVISGTDGRFVVDGPFTETREAVGGYLVLQADSFGEAVEIARGNPALRHGSALKCARSSRSVRYSHVTRNCSGARKRAPLGQNQRWPRWRPSPSI